MEDEAEDYQEDEEGPDSPMDPSISAHQGYRGEGMTTEKDDSGLDKASGACLIRWPYLCAVLKSVAVFQVTLRRRKMRRSRQIFGKKPAGLS